MMVSFRHVFVLAASCVAFVALAAIIRISSSMPAVSFSAAAAAEAVDTQGAAEPLKPEQSFFEDPAVISPRPESAPSAHIPVAEAQTSTVTPDLTPAAAPISAPAPAPQPIQVPAPAPVPVSEPTPALEPAPAPAYVAPDPVTATAYLVGDIDTGKVYLQKNSTTVLPFASMSKLITAIVATNGNKLTDIAAVTVADAAVPADGSGIHAGEKFTVNELLYAMLLDSSNVAAEALSSISDRSKFIEAMSGYAWEIGMPNSFFADPTGLSSKNAGTAKGFFAMARYLYDKRPDILAMTRTPRMTVASTTDHGAHVFESIHPFVSDPRFLGGKTGHTDAAGDTMLTIMDIKGHKIAIIVLHSDGVRESDTKILIDRVSAML